MRTHMPKFRRMHVNVVYVDVHDVDAHVCIDVYERAYVLVYVDVRVHMKTCTMLFAWKAYLILKHTCRYCH